MKMMSNTGMLQRFKSKNKRKNKKKKNCRDKYSLREDKNRYGHRENQQNPLISVPNLNQNKLRNIKIPPNSLINKETQA